MSSGRPRDLRAWLRRVDDFGELQASPRLVRETVSKWQAIFADPRFPLPDSAVPSANVAE